MKNIFVQVFILGILLFLSACSNDTSPKQDETVAGSLIVEVDQMILASLNIQRTIISTFVTDVNTTDALIKNSYSMMDSSKKMATNITNNIELINTLMLSFTQKFTLQSEYVSTFSSVLNFDRLTPYLIFSTTEYSKNYLLFSSSTPMFLNQQTVKTLFNTPLSLVTAWQRAIEFSGDKNLFLNIYEVNSNGSTHSIGSTFMILKDQVNALKLEV